MQAAAPLLTIGSAGAAFPIVGGAIGAGLAIDSANRQNDAIARSMRSSVSSGRATMDQLAEAAAQKRQQRVREAQRVSGRIRAALADSGTGFGGSAGDLEAQAAIDAGTDLSAISANYSAEALRVRSGVAANLQSLEAQTQNPLLAGLGGALSGASTGLSLLNAVEGIAGASAAADELAKQRAITEAMRARVAMPAALRPVATTGLSIDGVDQIPDYGGSVFA